jgi:hypothetical protein
MHYELPLEQLVRRRGKVFQLAFANEAKELMPPAEDFALDASRRGLLVLASNEEALERPVQVLRDVYGAELLAEPPRVRLIGGVQLKEPIMHLRVSLYANFASR